MAEGDEPLDELLSDAESAREEDLRILGDEQFQIIRFTSGDREFAIPIECVERTERVPPITTVPRCPSYIHGIASLRGGVVCVVDLAAFLSEAQAISLQEARSLLIIGVSGRRVGVLSETLPDFERIHEQDTLAIPTTDMEVYSGALERQSGLVGILDPGKLMDRLEERLADEVS